MKKIDINILDPVCVQQKGHNLIALKSYAELFRNKYGILPKLHYSRALSDEDICILKDYQCVASFHHYYIKDLPVKKYSEESHAILDEARIFSDSLLKKFAAQDVEKIFSNLNTKNRSVLFFPSIDFYTANAIFDHLRLIAPIDCPHIIIRWIGVMENVNYSRLPAPLEFLVSRLRSLIEDGYPIRNSAEGSSYAALLSGMLRDHVSLSPTLVAEREPFEMSGNECFSILFPGSGRMDKGYDRIHSIVCGLKEKHPNFKFILNLQGLQNKEFSDNYNIVRKLVAFSEVILQPETISQIELKNNFNSSDLICMPYSSETYEWRSSAIMAEAAMYGRFVMASDGCGFSDELRYFGIGRTARNNDEMVEGIYKYSQRNRYEKWHMALQARNRFIEHVDTSYIKLFHKITQ